MSSSMEAKLKSAESSLAFAQSEHKKVLAQLHQEIQKLQQKCAGKTVFHIHKRTNRLTRK